MCTMKELACSMSFTNFDKFATTLVGFMKGVGDRKETLRCLHTVCPLLQWPLGVTRKRLDGQRLKWFHGSSFAVMCSASKHVFKQEHKFVGP